MRTVCGEPCETRERKGACILFVLPHLQSFRRAQLDKYAFYLICGYALFSNISTALSNVFLVPLTVLLLLRLWSKRDAWRSILPGGQLTLALFIFVGGLVISSVFSPEPLVSFRTLVDDYTFRMVPLYAVLLFIRERKKIGMIALCIVISFTVNNIAIIAQGAFLGENRPAGFSFYMSVATISSMIIPSMLVILLSKKLPKFYQSIGWITLVCSVFSLYYNSTRGAWLAVAVTSFIACGLLIQKKGKFLIGVFLSCLVVFGACMLSPQLSERLVSISDMRMQSNSERLLLWRGTWHMIEDHPFVGVGRTRFASEYQGHYILPEAKEPHLAHAHNNFMHIFAECGLFGILGFCFFWWSYISYAFGVWKRSHSFIGLVLFSVLAGFFLHGMTEYTMGRTVVMKLYWLLVGLCLAWIRLDSKGKGNIVTR